MFYRTIGEIKVKHRLPKDPQAGDTFFDEDTGAFYIYYGNIGGWLQVSAEDLEFKDGC